MEVVNNLFVATTYEIDTTFDSEKFIKLRVRVCHDGVNPNNSNFNLENIEKAKNSILNIPILAFLYFDEEGNPQFGSHEMHLEVDKTNKDEIKLIYDEIPVGLVPESCNYEIKEFNGRNYVYVDAYVWKNYSNYVEDVIARDKELNVSMEIDVNEYKYNKEINSFDIVDYKYTAITLLGNDVGTGMIDAKAKTYNFSNEEKNDKFNELKQELEKEIIFSNKFSEKGGKKDLDEKLELLKKFNLDVNSIDFSLEDFSLEDLNDKLEKEFNESKPQETVLFSTTVNQKREILRNSLDDKIIKDENGNVIEEVWYWVEDFDDKYVYVENYHWKINEGSDVKYGRFMYSFDESTMTATITSDFEEMVKVWLTIEEKNKLDQDRNNYEKFLVDFEEYKNTHTKLDTEFEDLRQFKENALNEKFENGVKGIFDNFSIRLKDSDEFAELKENYKNFSLEEIETKCFCMVGKLSVEFSAKSKKDNSNGVVKLGVDHKEDDELDDGYGGLLSKKYSK